MRRISRKNGKAEGFDGRCRLDPCGCAARSVKQPTVMAQFGIFEVLNCSGEEKCMAISFMRMGFFAQAVPSADRGHCFVEMLNVLIESSRASIAWF